jgi:hypothetical protein
MNVADCPPVMVLAVGIVPNRNEIAACRNPISDRRLRQGCSFGSRGAAAGGGRPAMIDLSSC